MRGAGSDKRASTISSIPSGSIIQTPRVVQPCKFKICNSEKDLLESPLNICKTIIKYPFLFPLKSAVCMHGVTLWEQFVEQISCYCTTNKLTALHMYFCYKSNLSLESFLIAKNMLKYLFMGP